jgi:hypothetical protein
MSDWHLSVLFLHSSHTAISMKKKQFVVDNGTDGFDLHWLEDGVYVHTMSTGIPLKQVPKQVVFGEDSCIVAGGSDHGVVYIFDRESGRPLEVLHHADKGLVQTIEVETLLASVATSLTPMSHRQTKTMGKAPSYVLHRVVSEISTFACGLESSDRSMCQIHPAAHGAYSPS